MKLILASGSPRRKEIMTNLGYEYEIIKAVKDEVTTKTKPSEVVMELAKNKALEVLETMPYKEEECLILSADTIVAIDDEILGKPVDNEDAFSMLRKLSGNVHHVYTGVCIINSLTSEEKVFYEKTGVHVKSMSDDEINDYLKTGESLDKAGAYGIQGEFKRYIEGFEGDYLNVVGLPATRVKACLEEMGL